MPSFRKLSPAETAMSQHTPSARAQVAQEYDALLVDFVIDEYGRAELVDGEQRNAVRSRLHAAARRRGLALRFRPGPGPLIFCVEAVSSVPITPTVVETASTPDHGSPQRVIPPRRQSEQRKPAGRYDAVLPRWMREGQSASRREGRKRRAR